VRSEEKAVREKAEEVIDFLEIPQVADELAGNLSGGQKKLLELGRTMMVDAKIVFLDEVGAGVNRTLLGTIGTAIKRLNEERGYTFCMIEHDMDFIGRMCDHLSFLEAAFSQENCTQISKTHSICPDDRIVTATRLDGVFSVRGNKLAGTALVMDVPKGEVSLFDLQEVMRHYSSLGFGNDFAYSEIAMTAPIGSKSISFQHDNSHLPASRMNISKGFLVTYIQDAQAIIVIHSSFTGGLMPKPKKFPFLEEMIASHQSLLLDLRRVNE